MSTLLLALILLVGSPATSGSSSHQHPSFTGTWVLIAEKSPDNGAHSFSDKFVAAQDGISVRVVFHRVFPGRGGPVRMLEVEESFRFDGSPTNLHWIGVAKGSPVVYSDTAAWEGEKLVVTTRASSRNRATAVSKTTALWILSDGVLVVETTSIGSGTTVRDYYRTERE